jgi:hypothetical protein
MDATKRAQKPFSYGSTAGPAGFFPRRKMPAAIRARSAELVTERLRGLIALAHFRKNTWVVSGFGNHPRMNQSSGDFLPRETCLAGSARQCTLTA